MALSDSPRSKAILVLDATTGQNAISQVEAFQAAVSLTGLIMTKLDGTAKGGILVALADRLPDEASTPRQEVPSDGRLDARSFLRA